MGTPDGKLSLNQPIQGSATKTPDDVVTVDGGRETHHDDVGFGLMICQRNRSWIRPATVRVLWSVVPDWVGSRVSRLRRGADE